MSFTHPVKRINAYVEKNESHRKYTSIDIQNITGEEETETLPTTTTKQVFLVHLYYKTKATGADQEPKIKTTEDEIFNSLDALQTMAGNVQVLQSWDRKSETFPVSRVHSTIRVTSEAISSTDGEGIRGDQISILLPISPNGLINIINVISDESGVIKDLDISITSEQVYTRIRNTGLLSVQIAVSKQTEDDIKDLIFATDNTNIVFSKGTAVDIRTANLSTLTASGTRGEIQTQILTMDIQY